MGLSTHQKNHRALDAELRKSGMRVYQMNATRFTKGGPRTWTVLGGNETAHVVTATGFTFPKRELLAKIRLLSL